MNTATTSRSDRLNGKEIADTVLVAFEYTVRSLGALGYDTTKSTMLDLAQRLATTIAIKALDLRLDLRAELGAEIVKKNGGSDEQPKGPRDRGEDFIMPSGEHAGKNIQEVDSTYLRKVYTPTLKADLRSAIEREAERRDDKALLAVIAGAKSGAGVKE